MPSCKTTKLATQHTQMLHPHQSGSLTRLLTPFFPVFD